MQQACREQTHGINSDRQSYVQFSIALNANVSSHYASYVNFLRKLRFVYLVNFDEMPKKEQGIGGNRGGIVKGWTVCQCLPIFAHNCSCTRAWNIYARVAVACHLSATVSWVARYFSWTPTSTRRRHGRLISQDLLLEAETIPSLGRNVNSKRFAEFIRRWRAWRLM